MRSNWLKGVACIPFGSGLDFVIVMVVADIVHGWDADTAANLIEQRVGRDLQFIRINGTLVGGLAGLTLYTLWHWLT